MKYIVYVTMAVEIEEESASMADICARVELSGAEKKIVKTQVFRKIEDETLV